MIIQSPGFSPSPDEELKLSVKKSINPKTSALKVTNIDKILERLETLTPKHSNEYNLLKIFVLLPQTFKIQMSLPDFVNGYGLAERVRIGPKELAALSLFLDMMKKIKKKLTCGTVKDDVFF